MVDLDFSNVTSVREHVARLDAQKQIQDLSSALEDLLRQIARRGPRKELVAQAEVTRDDLLRIVEEHFEALPEPGSLPSPPPPPAPDLNAPNAAPPSPLPPTPPPDTS